MLKQKPRKTESLASMTKSLQLLEMEQDYAHLLDPELLQLFETLLTLPEKTQKLLAPLLIKFAGSIKELQYYQCNLKSAGADRLIAYLKVQMIWPHIAEAKHLSRAFKTCVIMDEMAQSALCFKIMPTMRLIENYYSLCQKKRVRPDMDQLETILVSGFMLASNAKVAAKYKNR